MSDCPCPPGDMEEPDWAAVGVQEKDLADARRYWATIVADLAQQQTLAEANRHAISRLVLTYILYEDAIADVLKRGSIIKAKRTGVDQHNPNAGEAKKLHQMIRQLEADLGIGPGKRAAAAKGKVAAKKKPRGGAAGDDGAVEF